MMKPMQVMPILLLFVYISRSSLSDDIRNLIEILIGLKNTNVGDSSIHAPGNGTHTHHTIQHVLCKKKGVLPYTVNCPHGKLMLPDGCCRCVCRKNYAAISSSECKRASWSSWGAWSTCIETKWGGLQTKERVCRSNGREAPGTCVGRGSRSKACSAVTADFRIRKNLRDLTNDEMHDLIQAMTKFKADNSKKGYSNIVSWHGYPGRCPWYNYIEERDDAHCSWHYHPLFLPWHRMIMVQLELGLQRYLKNKSMGIPYWDWTEHALDIPYLLRHPQIYDPVLKRYVRNPFYRSEIVRKNCRNIPKYTHRNIYYPGVLMDDYLRKGTIRALLSHNYYKFDNQLASAPHDQIHNCFCYKSPSNIRDKRRCDYGMSTVGFAAWDPAFLLHHSSIDRMFVMRRLLEEYAGISDWTKSRVIGEYLQYLPHSKAVASRIAEAFDQPMSPFCNASMNPETITRRDGVWTLRRSYYNEALFGYKYQNFDLGNGYSWKDLKRDFALNNVLRVHWDDENLESKQGTLGPNLCKNMQMYPSSGCVTNC